MKDKYYFLLYLPIVYLVPPLHETVHVLIGWMFGVRTVSLGLSITYLESTGSTTHWMLQNIWDSYFMMTTLCLISITMFIHYYFETHHIRVDWDRIRSFLHVKEA
jgi:hypothetical protein